MLCRSWALLDRERSVRNCEQLIESEELKLLTTLLMATCRDDFRGLLPRSWGRVFLGLASIR
jgi:hypothetical protein